MCSSASGASGSSASRPPVDGGRQRVARRGRRVAGGLRERRPRARQREQAPRTSGEPPRPTRESGPGSGAYFLKRLRTSGAEAAAAAPSRAARTRAFFLGSIPFHSLARRVTVLREAFEALPTGARVTRGRALARGLRDGGARDRDAAGDRSDHALEGLRRARRIFRRGRGGRLPRRGRAGLPARAAVLPAGAGLRRRLSARSARPLPSRSLSMVSSGFMSNTPCRRSLRGQAGRTCHSAFNPGSRAGDRLRTPGRDTESSIFLAAYILRHGNGRRPRPGGARLAWYRRNRERGRRDASTRSARRPTRRGRSALRNPDLLLRGAPSGLRRQHAASSAASASPGSTRSSRCSSSGASIPRTRAQIPGGSLARWPSRDRDPQLRRRRRPAILDAIAQRATSRTRTTRCSRRGLAVVHGARARGRCTRRRSPTSGTGCPTIRRSGRPDSPRPIRAASRRSPRRRADPGRPRDARRRRRDAIPFGWDNEFPRRIASTSPRSRSTSTASPTATTWSSSRRAATRTRPLGRRGLALAPEHGVRHPLFWEMQRGVWFWRGHVGPASRCRWPGRSTSRTPRRRRTRAGRSGGCRPRPSSTARPSARPTGAERAHPWGDEPPDATRGNFDFRQRRSGARRLVSARARAPGACSDLVGNGWEWTVDGLRAASRASRRWPSYPAVLGRLLRREALRHEGRLAGDGEGARAAQLPQLVPGNYPYVYAKFRLRERQ